MPTGHDFMEDFVQSYFKGQAQKEQARQFDIEQAYRNTRLAQELDLHKQTMAQRGKEFVNEQAFKSAQLELQRRNADLQASRNAREEKNQIRDDLRAFTKDGEGYFMPEPKDQPIPYTVGGTPTSQGPIDLSFMGAPKPPVGPSRLQAMGYSDTPESEATALIQAIPQAPLPAIPMEGTMPAAAQMPPASYAQPLPAMEGQPPGTIAMQKTGQQIAYEKARAKYESEHAEDIDTPPILEEWLGVKLPPKMKTDSIVRITEARIKDIEGRADKLKSEGFMEESLKLRAEANADRRMFGLLAAQRKVGNEADIEANHSSVMNNPDTFHELSREEKSAERARLAAEGLPAPRKVGQRIESTEFFATRAIQSSNRIIEMLQDPTKVSKIMKRLGPLLGREGNIEQAIGKAAALGDNPEAQETRQLLQEFRSLNNYLVFQEGQSLFGGRIPIQLMQQLATSSPNTAKALPEFIGSINAVKRNSEDALVAGETYRFGGKTRPNFYKLNNITGHEKIQTEVTNFPTDRANTIEEGAIKVFTNPKTGVSRTITKRDGKIYEIVTK